jgi:hypothetical protein
LLAPVGRYTRDRALGNLDDESTSVAVELNCKQINLRLAESAEMWKGPLKAAASESWHKQPLERGLHVISFMSGVSDCKANSPPVAFQDGFECN